ncbi:hypothetical protein [Streptomyces meridianus]|uniref:Tat pathway signal protein n=1 Tax=Streptomyces meridianus TaxID=2938945 RepID=A0ABT0X3T3_9ACTN|nr:hypothetical protein [Streptomyces meridianus]MCM2577201.1 hypothetical protein [Streptomyces meridianus]
MTTPISRRAALRAAALLTAYGALPQNSPAHAAPGPAGPAADPDDLAHYYRFREIVEGRRMVQSEDGWTFNGPAIPFDPDGVHPVVDSPDTASLPEGSPQRAASEECDRAYTDMLRALNRVFDGHPGELHHVTAMMFALEGQARKLLTIPSAPGATTVLGPAFRLVDGDGPEN